MKNTRKSRCLTTWVAGLALLLSTAIGLQAKDWSAVPADQLVAQAIAAVSATAEQNPAGLAEELAAILNAAAAIEGLTDDDLILIVAAAYAGQNVNPLLLARATYARIDQNHRGRIADILLAAAPADAKADIVAAIAALNLPPVPPAGTTVREPTLPTVSKE